MVFRAWPSEAQWPIISKKCCDFLYMIVFLNSDQNPFTAYLNPPIKAHKVRLISCSLYNSWHNLIAGFITKGSKQHLIPHSHYTPQTLAKELAKRDVTLTTGLPHEWKLTHDKSTTLNQRIKDLIGHKVVTLAGQNIDTFHWNVPSNYEIHCDLVYTYENGSRSNVMAKFPPKGNPFDLVEYRPISLYYDICDLVTEVNITVKVDGKVVDFNRRQISLVLEFI